MEQSTILHNVSADQINLMFKELHDQLAELKQKFEPKTPPEYLTRNEVADLLKVDLSTLWNWQQKGKLMPYGIGNRVLYKRTDIEAVLTPLGKKKGAENG